MFHERTSTAAKGKWRGILMELGVPDSFLSKKHGPCPFCSGTDRFRFLDKDGTGSWVCNQCRQTPGTGMDFVMEHTGLDFRGAAARVDEIVGNIKPDTTLQQRPELTEAERKGMLRSLWNAAKPLQPGDVVTRYLDGRGLIAETPELRCADAVKDGDGNVFACMVARVLTPEGDRVATLHRTFLKRDGSGKAEIASPRKLMPGGLPPGSAIRLGPVKASLGVAEGIETALAASQMFELPVWSAINAGNLEKWMPPDGVEDVTIFADADPGFAGQAAAYALAKRLRAKGLDVTVKAPDAGDWNDALLAEKGKSA